MFEDSELIIIKMKKKEIDTRQHKWKNMCVQKQPLSNTEREIN